MGEREPKVFLTGHRGFIGSVVHAHLPGARTLERKGATTAELVEMLRGVDCVVHLAGGGGGRFCQQHPREAVENNVVLTHRLVDAARRAGVQRFVFASSIAVYGTERAPPNPIGEDDPAEPDDLYGALKRACEEIVRSLPHTILRFANVYGFGTGANLDRGGFVHAICRSARSTGRIVLTSASLALDLVHVEDVARAVVACLQSDRGRDQTLNVGSGGATALVDCARMVAERMGAPIEVAIEDRPGARTRWLDIRRAQALLGWQPTVTLSDGIAELIARMR